MENIEAKALLYRNLFNVLQNVNVRWNIRVFSDGWWWKKWEQEKESNLQYQDSVSVYHDVTLRDEIVRVENVTLQKFHHAEHAYPLSFCQQKRENITLVAVKTDETHWNLISHKTQANTDSSFAELGSFSLMWQFITW